MLGDSVLVILRSGVQSLFIQVKANILKSFRSTMLFALPHDEGMEQHSRPRAALFKLLVCYVRIAAVDSASLYLLLITCCHDLFLETYRVKFSAPSL